MSLIQRVQDILLKPKETWPAIAAEPASVASIYQNWLIVLAAIPPIAAFIGLSVIGVGGFGFGFRIPILSGLIHMVFSYVLSLVVIFVLALIVDALAPTFGGTKNQVAALKVVAYGSTAGFIAGLFNLLPMLSMLGLLVSLYSIYLIYLGLPVLMKTPPDKAVPYTAVVIVCGIVAMVVLSVVSAALLPMRGMGMMGGVGGVSAPEREVTIKTPGGEVTFDTKKMEEMARKMEEASKKMEQAQKSGDGAAAGKALGEMMGAAGGGTPLPAAELKALLPESTAGMKRESYEAQSNAALGISGSSAQGRYVDGDRRIELSITDMGSLAGLAAMAGWANVQVDKESSDGTERVYKQGQRTMREEFRKSENRAEVTALLANGIVVEAKGQGVDLKTLKGVVEGVDLGRLEAMQRPTK